MKAHTNHKMKTGPSQQKASLLVQKRKVQKTVRKECERPPNRFDICFKQKDAIRKKCHTSKCTKLPCNTG